MGLNQTNPRAPSNHSIGLGVGEARPLRAISLLVPRSRTGRPDVERVYARPRGDRGVRAATAARGYHVATGNAQTARRIQNSIERAKYDATQAKRLAKSVYLMQNPRNARSPYETRAAHPNLHTRVDRKRGRAELRDARVLMGANHLRR